MEDASPTVQDMLSFMDGSDYFDPHYTTSMKDGTEMMDRREVDAIIRGAAEFHGKPFPWRQPCADYSLGCGVRLPRDGRFLS